MLAIAKYSSIKLSAVKWQAKIMLSDWWPIKNQNYSKIWNSPGPLSLRLRFKYGSNHYASGELPIAGISISNECTRSKIEQPRMW